MTCGFAFVGYNHASFPTKSVDDEKIHAAKMPWEDVKSEE